jgi:hypothetical protein
VESEPSLVFRIYEWILAVVWNWRGSVAGVSLVSGFALKLFPEVERRLDRIIRPERRRHALIGLCLLLLLYSLFLVYDDVSTRLRHVSAQLPDFEKVTTWGVSFEAGGVVSGGYSDDIKSLFYMLIQGCSFYNLSVTQKRVLDLKLEISTDDPDLPMMTFNTENMLIQEYRKTFIEHGMAVDEKASPRKVTLLKTPIELEPGQWREGIIEFDVYDDNVKRKMQSSRWWSQAAAHGTVSVTDHRSGMTKTIKLGQAYNAITGGITAKGS